MGFYILMSLHVQQSSVNKMQIANKTCKSNRCVVCLMRLRQCITHKHVVNSLKKNRFPRENIEQKHDENEQDCLRTIPC